LEGNNRERVGRVERVVHRGEAVGGRDSDETASVAEKAVLHVKRAPDERGVDDVRVLDAHGVRELTVIVFEVFAQTEVLRSTHVRQCQLDGRRVVGFRISIKRKVTRLNSKQEDLEAFSSAGPTLDGRVKPDVVAPGGDVQSADRITDDNFKDGDVCRLIYKSGTSMATPIVAGAMTLIRQYFTDGFYPKGIKNTQNAFEPSAALLKAVLINGAQPMNGHTSDGRPIDIVPSCRQGWGRVNVTNSLVLPDQGELQVKPAIYAFDQRDKPFVTTGQIYGVCLQIVAGEKDLSATLVWTDPPPAVVSDGTLVNDLDLQLFQYSEGVKKNFGHWKVKMTGLTTSKNSHEVFQSSEDISCA
jgi:hypothetical protein